MKNGKYSKRKGVATKTLVMALAVMLIVGCTVGGTLAWLTTKTDSVVNTFTVGDINIELTETWNTDTDEDETLDAWTGKIVPGNNLSKDPKVTVLKDSEACWLFVKVVEANWPTCVDTDEEGNETRKVDYAIAEGWNQLTDENGDEIEGVYYREVPATTTDSATYQVLKNNQVTVSGTLTKDEIKTISGTSSPTLTITAAAIQKDNISTVAEAYANLPDAFKA